MLSAKAVLPTDGLAARMTSAPGCSPSSFSSSDAMPVGTPVMADCPSWMRFCVASMASMARIIGSEMRFSVSVVPPLRELGAGGENELVGVEVEILRLDHGRHEVEGRVLDEQRPENRLLRLE